MSTEQLNFVSLLTHEIHHIADIPEFCCDLTGILNSVEIFCSCIKRGSGIYGHIEDYFHYIGDQSQISKQLDVFNINKLISNMIE